jgi:hypothetical protein
MHKLLAFSMHKRRGTTPSSYVMTCPDMSPADHRWLIANHTRASHHLSIGMLAVEQALRIPSGRISGGSVARPSPHRSQDFLLAPVAAPVVAYCVRFNSYAER